MPTEAEQLEKSLWAAAKDQKVNYLKFEDGLVKLGDEIVPGILLQQSVRCAVRYDESKHDQMSGKKKVILGWEDAQITLVLDLLTDKDGDCYKKLAKIDEMFKGAKKSHPKIYEVSGRHLNARRIRRVVFDTLDSWESDEDDTIQATLTFVEHLPPVVKRERQHTAAKAKGAPAVKAQPAAAPAITEDTTNPFLAGLTAGGS